MAAASQALDFEQFGSSRLPNVNGVTVIVDLVLWKEEMEGKRIRSRIYGETRSPLPFFSGWHKKIIRGGTEISVDRRLAPGRNGGLD